jgi:hypothetical protein
VEEVAYLTGMEVVTMMKVAVGIKSMKNDIRNESPNTTPVT